MTERYSRTQIENHINNEGNGLNYGLVSPRYESAQMIRQLLADRDKLKIRLLKLHDCIRVIPNHLAASALMDSIESTLKEVGE